MKIDEGKLDRRLRSLKESAKRKNRFTDDDLGEFLTWKGQTLRNRDSERKLHRMKACDMVMLEILAGERIDIQGLARR